MQAILAISIALLVCGSANAQCANGVCTMPQQPHTAVYHYGQYGQAYAGFYTQHQPRRIRYIQRPAPVRYFVRQRPVRQMMCGPNGCR